jgi:hypothetical protein
VHRGRLLIAGAGVLVSAVVIASAIAAARPGQHDAGGVTPALAAGSPQRPRAPVFRPRRGGAGLVPGSGRPGHLVGPAGQFRFLVAPAPVAARTVAVVGLDVRHPGSEPDLVRPGPLSVRAALS